MYENFTLEKQRAVELERGWNPATSKALVYSTAEAVVAQLNAAAPLDSRILCARRIAGAPDCIGRWQAKWSTYQFPHEATPTQALERYFAATFGWKGMPGWHTCVGLIGPHIYNSTLTLDRRDMLLSVTGQGAEETPFRGTLHLVEAIRFDILAEGAYQKAFKDVCLMTLRDLIDQFGQDEKMLSWQMIASVFADPAFINSRGPILYYPPGLYRIPLRRN